MKEKMKTPIMLCLCMAIFHLSMAQDDPAPVSLDLLRAPVSPAANLLGISPSQIDKPSDPAAFMASINTASNNFSGLPTSYAVDLAPAWLFAGRRITLEDYLSQKAGKTIPQSLVVSLATHTVAGMADTMPDVTRFSAGVHISLLRGHASEESREKLDRLGESLRNLSAGFDKALDSLRKADPAYVYLDSMLMATLLHGDLTFEQKEDITRSIREAMAQADERMTKELRETLKEEFESARTAAEEVRIERYGFKLDLWGAMAWDFPGMNFNRGQGSAAALWATGGYECPCGFSALGIVRYIYQRALPYPGDQGLIKYMNTEAVDAGLRLIYAQPGTRFSGGMESLFRQKVNIQDDPFSWRFTVNAEYEVGRNKKLSLSFGKDFDGTLTGDSDLIMALNFLMGFGTGKQP